MKSRVMMMMALLLMATGINAQKIDQRLTRLVEKVQTRRAQGQAPLDAKAVNKSIAVDFNADGSIRAFSAIGTLNDGAECPTAQLEQMGITVRYHIGKLVGLTIPADKLMAMEQVEAFRFVQADEMKSYTNKTARLSSKAYDANDAIAATAAGLPNAYTGKGVVLGIIDDGIDFNHAAFRNADGTSRIKKIITPEGDNLTEYTVNPDYTADMELTSDYNYTSHGSHTSAIAGGSETGNGQQGVAPEVDLFLCGLGGNTSTNNINTCIEQIFKYADENNKPAVVSISLGGDLGFHDGVDGTAQTVATLTANGTKPGRAVVISSSNSAANWQSLLKTFDSTSEELKTVLGASKRPDSEENFVSYDTDYCFYASDYQEFDIQLKLVNLKTGELSDVGSHVLLKKEGTVKDLKIDKYGGQPRVTGDKGVLYYLECRSNPVKLDDSNYRLALVVKAGMSGQTIKMISGGEGNAEPCFDAPAREGEYSFATNGWTKGNSDFACNTMVCNDAVISIGSYITTNSWTPYQSSLTYSYAPSSLTGKKQEVGEISDFSSYCIDDNGKARPTAIAPGQGLVSAANNYDYTFFTQGQPGVVSNDRGTLISLVEKNSRHNWYYLTQGTSMSCPHAAGIIALWMQAKPTLTTNEINSVLKETCMNDEYTTNTAMIPSGNKTQAGYGKIDAVAGLKKILNITGIETIEVGGQRQATPATMYSVDAPVYNMMGQRVDKNTRGIVIYKGRKYVNK